MPHQHGGYSGYHGGSPGYEAGAGIRALFGMLAPESWREKVGMLRPEEIQVRKETRKETREKGLREEEAAGYRTGIEALDQGRYGAFGTEPGGLSGITAPKPLEKILGGLQESQKFQEQEGYKQRVEGAKHLRARGERLEDLLEGRKYSQAEFDRQLTAREASYEKRLRERPLTVKEEKAARERELRNKIKIQIAEEYPVLFQRGREEDAKRIEDAMVAAAELGQESYIDLDEAGAFKGVKKGKRPTPDYSSAQETEADLTPEQKAKSWIQRLLGWGQQAPSTPPSPGGPPQGWKIERRQ